VAFAFAPTSWVYAHKLAVFSIEDYPRFAVLQSSFHYWWAWQYCSTNLSLLNYSTTDGFETFPFPQDQSQLDKIRVGKSYYDFRSEVMRQRQEGLTKTYNRYHDPEETSRDFEKLREFHVEMDSQVAAAYNWTELDLGHDFHETKQGIRFTISDKARRETLQRLLNLNQDRYSEAMKHPDNKGSRVRTSKRNLPANPSSEYKQPKLF
jgi:hypothetical protein